MKRSSKRILTTHTGSFKRPPELGAMLVSRDDHEPTDVAALESATSAAILDVVRKQADAGLDIVNDGEFSKSSYATYVRERLSGFEAGETELRPLSSDARDFPGWAADRTPGRRAVVTGPLSWKDFSAVEKDIANLKTALQNSKAEEGFLTAVSPGTFCNHNGNRYYSSREYYLGAAAEVMRREYEAIASAGLILQLDCPDLAASRDTFYADLTESEFCQLAEQNVDALNYATRNIAPDQMRMHVCWGAGGGPHRHDIELKRVVGILMKARPLGLSIVAANGRHEHEWSVWQDVQVPDGKVIIPGVIDSTATIVEHPELVAERIVRFANILGKENVIAGVDCGFSSGARVDSQVVWEKLKSLSDGAALATWRLWIS